MQDPPESGSVAARIATTLAERIVLGVLAPGLPLRQDHVASEFGASHVPVREAFRRLEAQGLLVSEPRRGVRVAPLDRNTIDEISEMRAALEVLAVRHAIPKMTASDHTVIAQLLAEEAVAPSDDLARLAHLNVAFHMSLCAPCGMPRLLDTIEALHKSSMRILVAMWSMLPNWQESSRAEHVAIGSAASRGNVNEAAKLLGDHILGGGRELARASAPRTSS